MEPSIITIPVRIDDTPEMRVLLKKLCSESEEERKSAENAIAAVCSDVFIELIRKELKNIEL